MQVCLRKCNCIFLIDQLYKLPQNNPRW